jgi:asparagine synthase (glutamine-hydrolysing)
MPHSPRIHHDQVLVLDSGTGRLVAVAPESGNVTPLTKLPGYTRKHVLRRALSTQLPPAILAAPKRGFNVPMREWFRGDAAAAMLSRRLSGGGLDDLVDGRALQAIVTSHRNREADHGVHLWILLQLAAWSERMGWVTQRA